MREKTMEKKGREDEEREGGRRKGHENVVSSSKSVTNHSVSIQLDFPVANGNTTSLSMPVANFPIMFLLITMKGDKQCITHPLFSF
jgi:hypothetical protein